MPELASFARSAQVFSALGDESRLHLVAELTRNGPASTAVLAAGFAISRQAITKHLRVMEDAGLVRHERRGRETVWQLRAKRLAEARRHLKTISKEWDAALHRLKHFVED